jgi:hypothetical protein
LVGVGISDLLAIMLVLAHGHSNRTVVSYSDSTNARPQQSSAAAIPHG